MSPSAATLTINIHRKHIYESHSGGEAPYVKLTVKRLGRETASIQGLQILMEVPAETLKPYYEGYSQGTAL